MCVVAQVCCVAVRRGHTAETKGTAFVVYEDIYDAKNAVDHLSGFNVGGRYLIVLYYNPSKLNKDATTGQTKAEVEALKAKYGSSTE